MIKFEIFFLIGLSLLTIFFHWYDFGLPELNGDEMFVAKNSLTLVYPPNTDLYNYSEQYGAHFFNVPVWASPYVGGISAIFQAPIFYLFGYTPFSIRLFALLMINS